jgi:predicted negative regulator of RcsB-dependent stress response
MSLIEQISFTIKESQIQRTKIFMVIIISAMTIGTSLYDKYRAEKEREANLVYEKQVEQLDDIQDSIANLSEFVESQKTQLETSRQTIQKLEEEQEKLKPVVDADREVIDAILQLQDDKHRSRVWIDRGIGFSLGIIGSLIASIIWSAMRKGTPNKSGDGQ